MRKMVFALVIMMLFASLASSDAMMGSNTIQGMMGGGFAMSNSGSFGMMNGMAGAPVVGDEGTAYIVKMNPLSNPGTAPSSGSFESEVLAITPAGGTSSITLKGIVSRPVVLGNVFVATASLPDPNEYQTFGNFGNSPVSRQSVLYLTTVPFSSETKPIALLLDGYFASVPVITASHIYVATSDFGNAMMTGNGTFNYMYGNYNFNAGGTAKSYLYIFNLDGTLASKTVIQ